ncbi:MAG: T9SS type A sorting domain-containing protein, partial [Chitinispirillaceae bacterium]|nr:T9SS type A sorting domain-containing protein [Chitinispirillaceae bacterium]
TGTAVATGRVTVTVTVTPTADISNASLYSAVVEKKTTKNASTNGEKEFHYVMMKMVPNASGKPLTLRANTAVTVSDSAALSGTKIEEMSDLAVVSWVQVSGTREVLQSAVAAVDNTPVVNRCLLNGCSAGNPRTIIRNNVVVNAQNSLITIHDLSGREVVKLVSATATFDPAALNLPRGCYILKSGTGKQARTGLISLTR